MLNSRLFSVAQRRSNITRLANLQRSLSSSADVVDNDNKVDEAYAEEVIDTEGEWAGCTKRFLAPLQISVRGAGEYDTGIILLNFRKKSDESKILLNMNTLTNCLRRILVLFVIHFYRYFDKSSLQQRDSV